MQTTECPICREQLRASGVFALHAVARSHVQNSHPDKWIDLQAEERAIREDYARLVMRWGMAALPKRSL